MKKFFIFSVLLLFSLGNIFQIHSGRTDSHGGHHDTKTNAYHIH